MQTAVQEEQDDTHPVNCIGFLPLPRADTNNVCLCTPNHFDCTVCLFVRPSAYPPFLEVLVVLDYYTANVTAETHFLAYTIQPESEIHAGLGSIRIPSRGFRGAAPAMNRLPPRYFANKESKTTSHSGICTYEQPALREGEKVSAVQWHRT